MVKFRFIFLLAFIFLLIACAPSSPAGEAVDTARPTATAVATEPTAALTQTTTPTAEVVPTEAPVATEPVSIADVAAFVEQLQTAVTNQAYADMQSLMGDPIAVGAWRSEWRMYEPAQTIEQFQNASLPPPFGIQFTGLTDDEITGLIGQPPATMFGPETNVVAALHSTNWGQSSSDEAILFVTEQDGRYTWSGFLYTNGRFADANLGNTSAPVGLIYIIWGNGLYQIQPNGQHRQLLNAQESGIPNIRIAPDGRHAAYLNDERHLIIIDTATGVEERLGSGLDLNGGFLLWGNSRTLFVGTYLDPNEADGPNNGHIATFDITSGDLQILDETRLSGGRPALLSNYNMVAFDVFTTSQDDVLNGRLYSPDSGLQIFDHTSFSGNSGNPVFNPSWSPDPSKIAWMSYVGERRVLQVFEMEVKTAVTLFDWDPARFGGLVPSPVWSPNGRWLALEVVANDPQGSGIWLIAADGSSQTLVDGNGRDPYWVNDFQLIFNVNGTVHLYDITSSEAFIIADLPEGAWVLGITNPADLQADVTPAAEPTTEALDLPDPTTLALASDVTVTSPDGRWQATATQTEPVIVGDLEKLYVTLTVTDGTTTWEPIAEWRGYGLGYIWPAVYQWSADGRYLYYTNAGSADGCLYYSNGTDLHRLDLNDGTVTEILPAGKTINLSLSPAESMLAYTAYNTQSILFVLQDLAAGTEQSVVITDPGEYAQTAKIFWSADGKTAVLGLVYNACNPDETSSIFRINIDTVAATPLIEKDDRLFLISDWPDPAQDEIRLVDKDGNSWWLEITSGELAQEE